MTEHAEVFRCLLERRELLEELFFGEFLRRETAFALVVGVDEVFRADAPSSICNSWPISCRYTTCDTLVRRVNLISTLRTSLSGYIPAKKDR
jgi:hypothetical protein